MTGTPDLLRPITVGRPEDLDNAEPGIPYIVEVPDPPEDPEEYAEKFFPLDAAVRDRMRERFRPERPATPGPADPDRGQSDDRRPLVEPEPELVDPDLDDGSISVEFTDTHALITSVVDQKIVLSGDIRDGTASIAAGKTSRRKLTGEGNGYIEVNGRKWLY